MAQQMGQAGQTEATTAEQNIRTQGYNAGFRAGVTDYQNHAPYNFQSNPEYQSPTQGYVPNQQMDEQTYAMQYRSGFEAGYDDGYNGLTANQSASGRNRTYIGQRGQAGQAAAQPGANAGAVPAEGTGVLPSGSTLNLKLNNTLSTRSSNAGDTFTATITQPVYDQNSQAVLVPQGSTVEGRVASVQRSGGVSGTSQIQLNFQQLRLPDGQSYPLRAEVSQVNSQNGIGGTITGSPSTTNEGGVQQSQTRRTIGTAAASGAVGALIGAIAGGGKGAAIGTILGGGLGVVLASRNGALDLPAGTPITITLNSPVRIH